MSCKGRIRFLYLGICENLVHSCPRPSLRNDRKQADEHRCAIANWNARGKIKYDSYSIFKRGSCKTNNATYENFYHVQISTKYFVNNHLRQSARDFRLYTISVVNQKDVVVVEDKYKANFILKKQEKINPVITTLSKLNQIFVLTHHLTYIESHNSKKYQKDGSFFLQTFYDWYIHRIYYTIKKK